MRKNDFFSLLLVPVIFLGAAIFAFGEDQAPAPEPDPAAAAPAESAESEANEAAEPARSSSLPPSRADARRSREAAGEAEPEQEIDPETGEPIETLSEVEVRERVERDISDYVDSLEDLKTGEEREKELIRRYSDLTEQLLNRWTLPFIGETVAQRAAERQRMAEIERFEQEGKRDLEAIRQIDSEYHEVRREDYYETLYHARDRWYNNYEPRRQ